MSKFNQLSEQIDFLINMQQESLDECLQEFGQLINFIEKNSNNAEKYDENYEQGIEIIKKVLNQNFDHMHADYEEDISYLQKQKTIIDAVKTIEDAVKQEELQKMVIEDAGELEDLESFKKKSLKNNEMARSMFIQTVNDIKDIVQEGSLEEILALCEADQLAEAENFYAEDGDEAEDTAGLNSNKDKNNETEDDEDCEDDDCEDDDCEDENCEDNIGTFDLTENEAIKKMFEEMQKPFAVSTDEDKKDKE